jgi:hypothetical protein
MRLAVAHVAAPIDTPRAIQIPIWREWAKDVWVTTTKLGPGMVRTKNQIIARLLKTGTYSIDNSLIMGKTFMIHGVRGRLTSQISRLLYPFRKESVRGFFEMDRVQSPPLWIGEGL